MEQVTTITDALGYVTAYEYNEKGYPIKVTDGNGNESIFTYTNDGNSIQRAGGFAEAFDHIDGVLGMDLDTEIITFDHGGQEYRLQLWKGNYGFGEGYGGEIGLYSKDINDPSGWYDTVNGENEIRTSQTMYHDKTNEALMTHDTASAPGGLENGDSFWNLMIRMEDNDYANEDLRQESTLYIDNQEMREELERGLKNSINDGSTLEYKIEENKVIITYR